MPYVEGFGTWPFGEEWLWEALGVLAARVRLRSSPRKRPARRRRACCLRRADERARTGNRRAPAHLLGRRRDRARADRPRDHVAGVERVGVPGVGQLPRLPPPHGAPPQPVG